MHCQTRICRPVGLSQADCEEVCRYASERIGLGYDFKNIIDLMRYLVPWPMTQRWRRRTIALGSGDASRIICSSLIAQAFDAVRYPILPKITPVESGTARCEIAEIRHSSFYAPRDFDISPYFMVVKPTLARDFNYKNMHWADLPQIHTAQVTLAPEIEGAITEVAYARISLTKHSVAQTALCSSNWDGGGEMLNKEYLDTARPILRLASGEQHVAVGSCE